MICFILGYSGRLPPVAGPAIGRYVSRPRGTSRRNRLQTNDVKGHPRNNLKGVHGKESDK